MLIPEHARTRLSQFNWRDIRSGAFAILIILVALGCAVGSSLAAQEGNAATAAVLAGLSLVLAAAISLTIVPRLFRKARQEWTGLSFRFTRVGWIYLGILAIMALAAVNTGNNLIYMIFSSAMAVLLVSGILSRVNLAGLQASALLPGVIHAQQEFPSVVTLQNEKSWFPSVSILVEPGFDSLVSSEDPLTAPVQTPAAYYLYAAGQSASRTQIRTLISRRGRYQQSILRISSQFPFGFVKRGIRAAPTSEFFVFPEIEPPNEFFEILPLLNGSFESYYRGMGTDLYSIRDYAEGEDARFLDWKATAKTTKLKMREFTRQDERRCCFVFDNLYPDFSEDSRLSFEKAVRVCANAIRHFHEMDNETRLVTRSESTFFSKSAEALLEMMRILAVIEPQEEGAHDISRLAEDPSFKVVFTSSPRGSIPTAVWASSHVVFIRELTELNRR